MKIGITCYPTFGGSGAVATELGIELAKMGHCVHFISYGLPFRLNGSQKNINFHEVEVMAYPLFRYPPYTLSLSVKLSEVFESEKLDILHVHYAMPHATSAYLAQKIIGQDRLKFITTLHGTDITLVGNHHSFYRITKFSIENSNGVTCVSEYLRDATFKTFKISREKMKVIYNFVDTEKYRKEPQRDDWNFKKDINEIAGFDFLKKDDHVLSHISNFRPVKKVHNIIKAFCRISQSVQAKLLLVGDGPDLSWCKLIAEKLEISDRIFFMGLQEDIKPVLYASDLYLLPSKSESFGLSALEALSCSVPVVGTKFGGLGEVVVDGSCGFLVDPDNVDEIADASMKILCSRQTREKMSGEARMRAALFDSKIIVPQYLRYYNEVLNYV
ncbi:MAG: N-acetyl-alpha-D-glucosaminyl L-malate synthase BshA [Actinobacteria bacterium]|nr:N-acetyl-alpha-D-glucosaminyl L-malate synthase BshA [Actinomycetota bacterium]